MFDSATSWTTARQASLFFTTSWSLLKLMSIDSVIPLNHLILCHPLLLLPSVLPSIESFPVSWPFPWGGQRIGALASASVLPVNIQDWFPLGLIGLISWQSKGLSRVFSSTVWKHQFFGTSLLYDPTLTSVYDYLKNHSFGKTIDGPLSAKWCVCFLICCLGWLQFFFWGVSVF